MSDDNSSGLWTVAKIGALGVGIYLVYKLIKPLIDLGGDIAGGIKAGAQFVGDTASAAVATPTSIVGGLFGGCDWQPKPALMNFQNWSTSDKAHRFDNAVMGSDVIPIGDPLNEAVVSWAVDAADTLPAEYPDYTLVGSAYVSRRDFSQIDEALSRGFSRLVARYGGDAAAATHLVNACGTIINDCLGTSGQQATFLKGVCRRIVVMLWQQTRGVTPTLQ